VESLNSGITITRGLRSGAALDTRSAHHCLGHSQVAWKRRVSRANHPRLPGAHGRGHPCRTAVGRGFDGQHRCPL